MDYEYVQYDTQDYNLPSISDLMNGDLYNKYKHPIQKEDVTQSLVAPPSKTNFYAYAGPTDTKNNDIINRIIETANQQVGKKYVFGAKRYSKNYIPNTFDCSSLIHYAYGVNGISIPQTTRAMVKDTNAQTIKSLSDVQPGDLIVTSSSSSPSGGHVVMVTGVKDGKINIVEAKGKNSGVVRGIFNRNPKSIRRIMRYSMPAVRQLGGRLCRLLPKPTHKITPQFT